MGLRISTDVRNAMGTAVTDLLDAAGQAYVEVRTGAQPASPIAAATGTVLATFDLPDPSFGAWASGTAALNDIPAVDAIATGTAGHFRAYDNNGAAVFDGEAGTSGTQLNLSTTAITSGEPVSITSGSLIMPVGV